MEWVIVVYPLPRSRPQVEPGFDLTIFASGWPSKTELSPHVRLQETYGRKGPTPIFSSLRNFHFHHKWQTPPQLHAGGVGRQQPQVAGVIGTLNCTFLYHSGLRSPTVTLFDLTDAILFLHDLLFVCTSTLVMHVMCFMSMAVSIDDRTVSMPF